MKRFQSILCASFLTLVITSTAFASNGQITTMSNGQITTMSNGQITTMSNGQITTMSNGQITTMGNISTMSTSRSGLRAGRFSFKLTDYLFLFWATMGL